MSWLSQFSERADLQLHLRWLEFFQKILLSHKDIKAAALLGSFAKGHPDRLSDLDVLIWVNRENLKCVSKALFRLNFYNALHAWEKEYSDDHIFGKYIFDNFVSAEIHVLSLASDVRLRLPYIVMKDTDSFLNSRTDPGESPKHEDFTALPAGIEGLGWELFDMLKWWQRGNSELVKSHLKKIVARIEE